MMQDEMPGGHNERCVAVGTLDELRATREGMRLLLQDTGDAGGEPALFSTKVDRAGEKAIGRPGLAQLNTIPSTGIDASRSNNARPVIGTACF